MKLSLLHISDLHRDPDNPISNAALLTSLENDRRRYTTQAPTIRSPNLIVVSGDVVQGVRPDAPDPDKALKQQYPPPRLARSTIRIILARRSRTHFDVAAIRSSASISVLDLVPEGTRFGRAPSLPIGHIELMSFRLSVRGPKVVFSAPPAVPGLDRQRGGDCSPGSPCALGSAKLGPRIGVSRRNRNPLRYGRLCPDGARGYARQLLLSCATLESSK